MTPALRLAKILIFAALLYLCAALITAVFAA